MDQPLNTILLTAYTHEDALRRFDLVREFLETTFFVKTETANSLAARLQDFITTKKEITSIDAAALLSYGKEFYTGFTPENFSGLFNEFEQNLVHTPTITMYLPVGVDESDVIRLGKWFKLNIRKDALMRVHTDPGTAGGCAFVWKGVYHQYSLNLWGSAERPEFLRVIDSYKHA